MPQLVYLMGVVINFILHCYRCDTSKICVGFPWCLHASLAFAAATTVDVFTHKIYVQGDVPINHLCTVR